MGYNSNVWICALHGFAREAERMQIHNGKRAAVFGAAALAWLFVLFFFSGQSGAESGDLSGRLTQWLFGWWIERGADASLLEHLLRKTAHAGIFAVLGFLTGMSLLSMLNQREGSFLTLAVSALTAIANELHQLTAAGRSCNAVDMLIDTCGAAAGLLFAMVILHLFRPRKNKHYDR